MSGTYVISFRLVLPVTRKGTSDRLGLKEVDRFKLSEKKIAIQSFSSAVQKYCKDHGAVGWNFTKVRLATRGSHTMFLLNHPSVS